MLEDAPASIIATRWSATTFYVTVRPFLDHTCSELWIGKGSFAWPLHSPDLIPLIIYFQDILKGLVYQTPVNDPKTIVARIFVASDELLFIPGVFG